MTARHGVIHGVKSDAKTLKEASETLIGQLSSFPEVSGLEDNQSYDKNELTLNEVIANQIISITSTTSKNFLLNAKIVYRDSFITFTTSISLKKDNETFEKYNRIIKKFGTI